VILNEQLLNAKLSRSILETGQKLSQAYGAQQAESSPHDSQSQTVNKAKLQLLLLNSFYPPNTLDREVKGQAQKQHGVCEGKPAKGTLANNNTPRLLNHSFVGFSLVQHGVNAANDAAQ
jgi:hypothetical protein